MKLLAKDPAKRYPSADDLRADLRRFRQGAKIAPAPVIPVAAPAPAPTPREIDFGSYEDGRYVEPPRRSGYFLLFMILIFAGLAAGLWYLSQQLDEERDSVIVAVPDVVGQNKDRARRELIELGFRVEVQREASADIEVDVVIRQSPEPETDADRGGGGHDRDQRRQRDRSGARGAGPGRLLGAPPRSRPRASSSSRNRPRTPASSTPRVRSGSRARRRAPRRRSARSSSSGWSRCRRRPPRR